MSTYEKRTYRRLTADSVGAYLAATPAIAARLGGAPSEWSARDVADGNLNSVFLVDGPKGSLCVKQALPYVRVAGESWPLDITAPSSKRATARAWRRSSAAWRPNFTITIPSNSFS